MMQGSKSHVEFSKYLQLRQVSTLKSQKDEQMLEEFMQAFVSVQPNRNQIWRNLSSVYVLCMQPKSGLPNNNADYCASWDHLFLSQKQLGQTCQEFGSCIIGYIIVTPVKHNRCNLLVAEEEQDTQFHLIEWMDTRIRGFQLGLFMINQFCTSDFEVFPRVIPANSVEYWIEWFNSEEYECITVLDFRKLFQQMEGLPTQRLEWEEMFKRLAEDLSPTTVLERGASKLFQKRWLLQFQRECDAHEMHCCFCGRPNTSQECSKLDMCHLCSIDSNIDSVVLLSSKSTNPANYVWFKRAEVWPELQHCFYGWESCCEKLESIEQVVADSDRHLSKFQCSCCLQQAEVFTDSHSRCCSKNCEQFMYLYQKCMASKKGEKKRKCDDLLQIVV